MQTRTRSSNHKLGYLAARFKVQGASDSNQVVFKLNVRAICVVQFTHCSASLRSRCLSSAGLPRRKAISARTNWISGCDIDNTTRRTTDGADAVSARAIDRSSTLEGQSRLQSSRVCSGLSQNSDSGLFGYDEIVHCPWTCFVGAMKTFRYARYWTRRLIRLSHASWTT